MDDDTPVGEEPIGSRWERVLAAAQAEGRAASDHPHHRRRGHRHLGGLPADRPAARGDPVDPHRRLHRRRPQPGRRPPPAPPLPPHPGGGPRLSGGRGRLRRPAGAVRLPADQLAVPLRRPAADHGPPAREGARAPGPPPPAAAPVELGAEELPEDPDGRAEPGQAGPQHRHQPGPGRLLHPAVPDDHRLPVALHPARGPEPAGRLPQSALPRAARPGGGGGPGGVEVDHPLRARHGGALLPLRRGRLRHPGDPERALRVRSWGCGWPWWPWSHWWGG